MKRGAKTTVGVSTAIVLAGCMGAGSWSCTNVEDAFHCSFGGAASGERTETWSNTGTKALYSISVGGTGSATVTVKDAAGATVLSKTIQGTGGQQSNGETDAGRSGSWQVTMRISGAGGFEVTLSKR